MFLNLCVGPISLGVIFALVVKWLVSQLTHRGLEEKFYMDDGLLYGTPVAMKWALDLIGMLELVSGVVTERRIGGV